MGGGREGGHTHTSAKVSCLDKHILLLHLCINFIVCTANNIPIPFVEPTRATRVMYSHVT